jgi:hypothetical protein
MMGSFRCLPGSDGAQTELAEVTLLLLTLKRHGQSFWSARMSCRSADA